MRRILLYIFLLWAAALSAVQFGVNERFVSTVLEAPAESSDEKWEQALPEETIAVVVAANSNAEICAVRTFSFGAQLLRRYRPAGFSVEKCFFYQRTAVDFVADISYKSLQTTVQERAAVQKAAGYYVYALRRIII